MRISKCDKCGKIMKDKDRDKWAKGHIDGGDMRFIYFDLCEKCSKPLVNYLKKYLKIKIVLNKK